MSMVEVDLDKYQYRYDRFVVIKDFYRLGSAVMGFDETQDEPFRLALAKCLNLAEPPLQVIRLSGPHCLDMYSEYKPYTVFDDYKDLVQICLSGKCPGKANILIPDSPYKEEQRQIKLAMGLKVD